LLTAALYKQRVSSYPEQLKSRKVVVVVVVVVVVPTDEKGVAAIVLFR
jgi:hypothetical protein